MQKKEMEIKKIGNERIMIEESERKKETIDKEVGINE